MADTLTSTQYVVTVSDDAGRNKVLLTLDEAKVGGSASDFVFDVLGTDAPDQLVADRSLAEEAVPRLRALQRIVFDRDAQGPFIRDGIGLTADGKEVDPEASFKGCFAPREGGGLKYFACALTITTPEATYQALKREKLRPFQAMFVLHQIRRGVPIDVTRDDADLQGVLKDLDAKRLLDIDVKAATYKLTAEGERAWQSLHQEAQELIRRFDVFSDVEHRGGQVRFGTGIGQDLRVPVYELSGVDPFRARFVLGLNDGEWDELGAWSARVNDPAFYDEVFAPVEQAPSVEQIGRDRLASIVEQGQREQADRAQSAPPADGFYGPGDTVVETTTYGPGYGYGGYGYGYGYDPFWEGLFWWSLFW